MKLLLDENLAASAGFDAVITTDRGLAYEQNRDALPIAVVLILAKANTVEAIRPLYGKLLAELKRLQPREFIRIE